MVNVPICAYRRPKNKELVWPGELFSLTRQVKCIKLRLCWEVSILNKDCKHSFLLYKYVKLLCLGESEQLKKRLLFTSCSSFYLSFFVEDKERTWDQIRDCVYTLVSMDCILELLGKKSQTWKESGSRFGSPSLLAYGHREHLSPASEQDCLLLCWASFQLQSHRVVALSIKSSDTSWSTLEKEEQVVQPCVEVVQMPLFISSIGRQ